MDVLRGEERELKLSKSAYFSEEYFKLPQLISQVTQLRDVYRMRPSNIIEVGIGNGLFSNQLRNCGIDIVTIDINDSLSPDICCSIEEIPDNIEKFSKASKWDLLVCCEVLEHMPFSQFEKSIDIFKNISDRLYLTLPNFGKTVGMGGLLKIPRIGYVEASMYLNTHFGSIPDEHYWEVGSSKATRRKIIIDLLKKRYKNVIYSRYTFNPYHGSYECF